MADWRPKVKLPAKFRGVPFFVETVERTGGRRGPIHEYPNSDTPFKEDMGLAARAFPIEGFVEGDDYLDQKKNLIDKLEKKGPGELVHPYYGTLRVAVTAYRVRESTAEGGIARFSITFDESPAKAPQPKAVQNAKGKLTATAEKAKLAVGVEFLSKFGPSTLLGSVTGTLTSASRAMGRVLNTVRMETQALANLKRQVTELESDAVALANVPSDLLAAQLEIFDGLAEGLIESAIETLDAISPVQAVLSLYGFDAGIRPPGTTATRLVEQANFDANLRLHQRLVVIQACQIAAVQVFPSYDDAAAARQSITDLIDDQIETVADDVYPALLQLRADLVKAIPGDELEQARLIQHTPAFTVPSLVLSHRLYGDLSLESDLVKRNRIRNPAFVRGGVTLEILTRDA